MIDKTMVFIRHELNSHLRTHFGSAEDLAILSGLTNMDGSCAAGIDNKVVLALFDIEKESALHSLHAPHSATAGRAGLHLNLYFLAAVTAAGKNYPEGLSILSSTLAFFESRPVFDSLNAPLFPAELETLSVELLNLNSAETSDIWGAMGCSYLPSLAYKARVTSK